MTPEQFTMIERMREAGKSYKQIAARIGMSPGAVSWYCLRQAIESPRPGKCWDDIRGPATVARGNHVVRRFTRDEDELIVKMEREGASPSEIARALGRRPNSVTGRLATLARREERGQ
jgi:DNA-binding CsgD family transcriptional regulator